MFKIDSRILLILSSALAAICFFSAGLLYWHMEKITGDIENIRGEILGLNLRLKNFKSAKNLLEETREKREAAESIFVGPEELILFIEDLEKIGRESGVSLDVESASPASGNSAPSFRLGLRGDFQNLFLYLLLLENLPYEINLDEASLEKTSSGENNKKSSWSALYTIRLLSYEF